MCADGCTGCSAECAACASGCAGCAGCDSARLAAALRLLDADGLAFDPTQPRDAQGQWAEQPGSGWDVGTKPNGPIARPGSSRPALADRKAFDSLDEHGEVAKRMSNREDAVFLDTAVEMYGGNGYAHINSSLRAGKGLYPGEKQGVRALDSAIESSPLPQDTVLWRGSNGNLMFRAGWLDQSLVGAEWTDRSLTSTSANEDVGEFFSLSDAGDRPVLMRMIAPAGLGALRIGKWGRGGKGSGKEAEVLLGRNNRYRVVGDHGVVKGIRRIDVEVIPGDHGPVPE